MNLEGFSKRGMELGDDPEGIRETKDLRQQNANNDLRQQYIRTVQRLALQKMKNDLLFEGALGATIRKFSALGLNVSKESVLKDIQDEIHRRHPSLGLSSDDIRKRILASINSSQQEVERPTQFQNSIEQLDNDLRNILEAAPPQQQKIINESATIPKEPAIQTPQTYRTSIKESTVQQMSVEEQRKQEIRNQLRQEQEKLEKQLEWAKQQPNEPTITFTGDLSNLSDDIKQRIIKQIEAREGVIISEIDNIYQEGHYVGVDAKDYQGHFIGADFTLEDFVKLVNQPTTKARREEIKEQLFQEQPQTGTAPRIGQEVEQPKQKPISQEEEARILQNQQKQTKDKIVSKIMVAMNNAGELSFGDISMSERVNIMRNIQNELDSKSIDELQILLSTYQKQNVQEESQHSRMHK